MNSEPKTSADDSDIEDRAPSLEHLARDQAIGIKSQVAGLLFSSPEFRISSYLCRGKENIGVILGLYWDNGEENGNYYIIIGYHVRVILPQ